MNITNIRRAIACVTRCSTWALLVTVLLLGAVPGTSATPVTAAATESKLTITAQPRTGTSRRYLRPTDAAAVLATKAVTKAVSTTTRALQESLNLQERAANAVSLHEGFAIANTAVELSAPKHPKWSRDSGPLAVFELAHETWAKADTLEPLFSRSFAASQADVFAVFPRTATRTAATSLDLAWDVEDLSLRSRPTNSFAYLRDTVEVVQFNAEQTQTDTVGFITYLENGVETRRVFDLPGATTLNEWLDESIARRRNETIKFRHDASPVTVSVPLLQGTDTTENQRDLTLRITNTHTEISYEAPPRAAPQVAQLAGHAGGENNSLHWDRQTKTLSLDPLPLNVLDFGGDDANPHADGSDPLWGGILEMDDLLYVADSDGRRYFSGNELRLKDAEDNVLLRAVTPTFVFEDSLFPYQGFNLFAPILNMLEPDAESSPWLESFLDQVIPDSLYLPELFIGFDHVLLGDGLWKGDFDIAASAFLSFAGIPETLPAPVGVPATLSFAAGIPEAGSSFTAGIRETRSVPEPGMLWLLSVALLMLVALSRKPGSE